MFGITNIVAYTLSVFVVILLPGPNSIYCLTVAAKQGIRQGYCAVAGILLGDSLLMLLSALGAASVLKSSPYLFLLLKICGALYLSYLGVTMLMGSYQQFRQSQKEHDKPAGAGKQKTIEQHKPFIRALTLSLTNPKAILFFLSFFVLFVDSNYPNPAISFLVLGGILQLVSFSYLSMLVFVGTNLMFWFGGHKKLGMMAIAGVGMLFIGFSLGLLTASL